MMAPAPIAVRSAGRASDEQPSVIPLTAKMTTAMRFLRLQSAITNMALAFLVSQFHHQNSPFQDASARPRLLVLFGLSKVNSRGRSWRQSGADPVNCQGPTPSAGSKCRRIRFVAWGFL